MLKISQLITPQWPLSVQVKGRVEHQKLEGIKLSEEGMLKAKIGRKLGSSHQTTRLCLGRTCSLKRLNGSPSECMNKEPKQLSGVWGEDQTSHKIPVSQSLTQSTAPALFNSLKAERCRSCRKKV